MSTLIEIWDIERKRLFHRFGEDSYSSDVRQVTATSDSKYVVSANNDYTIGVWDIAEKKVLSCFTAKPGWISTRAVTPDSRFIVGAASDKQIGIWNFERRAYCGHEHKYLFRLNQCCRPLGQSTIEDTLETHRNSIAFLSKLSCIPYQWNALNFIIFLLPKSANTNFIDLAIENKIYFTLDSSRWAQIDYILLYNGERDNSQVDRFISCFLKNTAAFLNFNSLNRDKVICSISRAALRVFAEFGELSFFDVFNPSFTKDKVREYLLNTEDQLPMKGGLLFKNEKDFILFKGLEAKQEDLEKVIDPVAQTALDYSLVLWDCSYDIADPQTREWIRIFKKTENKILFTPATQNMVELLWRRATNNTNLGEIRVLCYFAWVVHLFCGHKEPYRNRRTQQITYISRRIGRSNVCV